MESQQLRAASEEHSQPESSRKLIVIAVLGAVSVLLALAAGAASWRSWTSTAASDIPPQAGSSPVQPGETPTPTYMPTVLPPEVSDTRGSGDFSRSTPTVSATASPATQQTSVLPLPTVTPTPGVLPVAPRDVEISGATTLRLSLSGAGFDSTGRPLSFSIDPRRYTLGDNRLSAVDEWCIQLGLVNQVFDVSMQLDPDTEALGVTGQIALREGFCQEPGAVMDTVDIDLSVPRDAAAQISYNLRGRRSLFGMAGLLDSDIGAIVELRITNSRPR